MSANAIDIFTQQESEVRGYCRRFTPLFKRAQGSLMEDAQGRQYLDFLAACGSLNYGHNDADMSAALVAHIQSQGITAGLDLYTSAKAEFLEAFRSCILQPRGLDYRVQFTGPTGTNAVEAALKLARKATGRHGIVSFTNGFHGVSLGALAATGNKYNRMNLHLPGVSRLPYDGYLNGSMDTAEYIEQMLNDPSSGVEPPAAFILETVQGEGGLNQVSAEWLQRIAAVAKAHGSLLIVDDIQAGCGRTGTFFSFEALGVTPDIVTLSKSISGYGLPMALVLLKPELDCWSPAEHNGTFRGNNHAFVTATVALRKFWSDREFEREIAKRATLIRQRLEETAKSIPGAYVKGRGMMQGLCVVDGQLADQIARTCFERGLIIETSGPHDEVIKVLCALNIPLEHLEQGLQIVHRAALQCVQQQHRDTPESTVLDFSVHDHNGSLSRSA